ncbi:ankyrin repeat domain-containing protein [Ralstonia sp. 24A2]|uniref:ankyrin repeat domain-containing protein n=1 Tax=Ralstonia sp. 24A2 TaxID=3447364 RepID=UPI003F6967E8
MTPFSSACLHRLVRLSVIFNVAFGSATLAMAASSAESEMAPEKQCEAIIDGDIQRLRALSEPLQPFRKCPHTVYTLGSIATENLRQDDWLAFRDLARPEDRAALNNMRLAFFINLAPNQLHMKPALRGIESMLDDGATPTRDGQYAWGDVGRFLQILGSGRATPEDTAQVARIFLDRLLDKAPAEQTANLSTLWSGVVDLPEPQRGEALQRLKAKFSQFTPSRDTWQQAPDVSYPLRSADITAAIRKRAPIDVVKALLDLHEPAPPEMAVWDAAIHAGRLDILESLIQRRYALPVERHSTGVWTSPLMSSAQVAVKGDTRPLEMMLGISPQPLIPDDVNQRMKTVLFRALDVIPEVQLKRFNDQLNAMSPPSRLVDVATRDARGYSLLVRAAIYGDLPLTKRLLDAGADPNAKSPSGLTALAYARCYGHPDVAQLLLQKSPAAQAGDCPR